MAVVDRYEELMAKLEIEIFCSLMDKSSGVWPPRALKQEAGIVTNIFKTLLMQADILKPMEDD